MGQACFENKQECWEEVTLKSRFKLWLTRISTRILYEECATGFPPFNHTEIYAVSNCGCVAVHCILRCHIWLCMQTMIAFVLMRHL